MDCKEIDSNQVCLVAADGTRVSAVAHYEYGLNDLGRVVIKATRFTDSTGDVVYDPALFSEVKAGACNLNEMCVESQEWTYGIDNTGTNFRWPSACYRLILSDGSTIEWEQTAAANGGWTPQMEEWGANIQAAADAAGILWFVETRFRNPSNPADLSGIDIFAGPPSEAVSNALTNMLWRYVNIQICPGQPVPVAAEVVEVKDAGGAATREPGYPLTTDGAVLGPISKFWLCKECGEEPVWYLEDGVTLAEAGQIPNCWEPCGTLTLTDAPPDRECEFKLDVACDNNNSQNTVDFTNTITRRATLCNGEQIAVDYFQADPDDPNALIEYELVGAFVDCATGEPVELPFEEPPKEYMPVGILWKWDEQEPSVGVEYWQPTEFGGSAAPHDNVTAIFGNDLMSHPNAPDYVFTMTDLNVSTPTPAFIAAAGIASRDETSGTDQIRITFHVCSDEPFTLEDSNQNTGERGALRLDGTLIVEDTTDSDTADRSAVPPVTIPSGIHEIVVATSDLSAWQGYQPSLPEGLEPYAEPLSWTPMPVFKCKELTGGLVDCDGNSVELNDKDFWTNPEPCCDTTSTSTQPSGYEGPTAEEIAKATVLAERDSVTGCIEKFQGTAPQQLTVPAGTRGNLISISDTGTGLVYFTLDGTAPGNTPTGPSRGEMSGQYLSAPIRNIDLSQVRFDGSSGASDYTVYYEKYN